MRGREQLLELFQRWDERQAPIPRDELLTAVQALDLDDDDLAAALGFDESGYRRTILHSSPHYQVLLLCWRSDQRSPIHDHRGSNCVVRVIKGRATETRFEPSPCGRLLPVWTQSHKAGDIAASCGSEIHQMGNFAGPGHNLVTLHVYSPPPALWRSYPVSQTALGDHDRLIEKPARTVRVDLEHPKSGTGNGIAASLAGTPGALVAVAPAERLIAIVGGGFSGGMVAVHLARLAGAAPLRIVLIEKGPRLARGLAYGTRCERHLLNVPAGLMSAIPDEPSHFLDWLKTRDSKAHAGTFAPRRLYGDYLEEMLLSAALHGAVPIELLRDEVVDLRMAGDESGRLALRTEGGQLLVADQVVLAMGNQPPQDPAAVARQTAVRRYASDPWGPSLLEGLGADEPIALIGSGLSAVDVVIEANSRGHRGVIYAISRHGLLPRRHQAAASRPQLQFGADCTTARSLLKAVRAEAAKCQAEGGDWRSVIDGIRPVAQSLWRSLKTCERERFLRHLASRWDVHRHRLAPEIDDLLQARMAEKRLIVIAGRVRALEDHDGHIQAMFQRRGSSSSETLEVSRVINCTGPARDIRQTGSKLLRSILASGIVRPGPLALGLDVADSDALIGADGQIHDRLFAIGPLLKEHLWETTAVRELRGQTLDLARRLLSTVEAPVPVQLVR
jgi:uncharacterized NAD(P)/FAD-binding protein YdhS